MHYWVPVLLILLVLFFVSGYFKSRNLKKKKLAEIREQWGKPKYTGRNFKLISAYLNTNKGGSDIADSTASDLDIDDVFSYIDHTSSKPGQQYLYKILHSPQIGKSYFKSLEQSIELVNSNQNLRELTQLKLSELGSNDAYYLPQLFCKPHAPIFSAAAKLYIVVSPLMTVFLTTKLTIRPDQFSLLLLLAMLIANLVIHYSNKSKMLSFTHSLPQLLTLNRVSKWMLNHRLFVKDDRIDNSLSNVDKLKRSLSFINLQNKTAVDPTDISYLITEWFKMFLVIEPLVFIISLNRVNKYLHDIKILYEAVAQVDTAISIQSVRDGARYYCKPVFQATGSNITIKNLYHPLIENCVANSISIDNKQGILVTGSNMSGKTTFIRAIALNVLLSQTINTCFANAYSAPPLKIFTSINMSDDLGDQKSYFQAEALAVKKIVMEAEAAKPVNSLVIIDEIFRGTNTIERIAAAKAVLSHFIENKSFVFVSTHDLELAELLGAEYKVFSFEELSGNDRLVFDYKLKEGLLKTRNGIAVLQGIGFPDSIINEANKVSIGLREKYDLL